MVAELFKGLFDSDMTTIISVKEFLLCLGSALIIGLILTAFYQYHAKYTKSFLVTLALLPAVVCVVIMMVNGNIGTGVAVAGAFSLVRFRSVPGSAREIGAIFMAMGTGLVVGMGYIAYGFLCALIFGLSGAIFNRIAPETKKRSSIYKTLTITIPEDLDYSDVFEPIIKEYSSSCDLTTVKTTNMGSLFRLTYDITLNKNANKKEMIDKLRCRNGNLEISISNQSNATAEL